MWSAISDRLPSFDDDHCHEPFYSLDYGQSINYSSRVHLSDRSPVPRYSHFRIPQETERVGTFKFRFVSFSLFLFFHARNKTEGFSVIIDQSAIVESNEIRFPLLSGSQQTGRWSGPREPEGLDRSKSAADSRAEGGAWCESCSETSSEAHCSEGAS